MWREPSAEPSEKVVSEIVAAGAGDLRPGRPPMVIAGGLGERRAAPDIEDGVGMLRYRRGLAGSISCEGIGLHSAQTVQLTLSPAEPGTGIVFCRTDLPDCRIAARHDHVVDTRLCTALADPARPEQRVGTIEHLMAALAGLAIDDATISVDGPELPILDGSAESFVFLIHCAGIVESAMPRRMIEVLRPVRVTDGAASAVLLPAPAQTGLSLDLEIDFPAEAVGRQHFALDLSPAAFERDLARARTFAFVAEIEALHAAGLALGGSLANAIVVDGAEVVNPEGLRYADEFVRHKLLDVVGDLALAGAPIIGRVKAVRSGHRLNNRLLHALFADQANYRVIPADALIAQPEAA